MILILSEDLDVSTTKVIDWLKKHKVSFVRINGENKISEFAYNLSEFSFCIGNKKVYSKNIKSFWYRRGELNIFIDNAVKSKLLKEVKKHTNQEFFNITTSIYDDLRNQSINSLGSFLTTSINKLITLKKATACGLLVPETVMLSDKTGLHNFFKKNNGRIITKTVNNVFNFKTEYENVMCYTESISEEDISNLPQTFNISLFQQKIEKKYELRIFFLKGTFYTMAIFSQLDKQTSVDFRKYNIQIPNRNVPFNLPKEIEIKLAQLMQECKLDTGSIDIIVDKNNDYYFLEVNPVGQFGMVSYPCNYNLEEKIAQQLI